MVSRHHPESDGRRTHLDLEQDVLESLGTAFPIVVPRRVLFVSVDTSRPVPSPGNDLDRDLGTILALTDELSG